MSSFLWTGSKQFITNGMREPFSLPHGVVFQHGTSRLTDFLLMHAGVSFEVPVTTFLSWIHGGPKAQLVRC
eukprot:4293543-Prorocentrum_lima.AAC.1